MLLNLLIFGKKTYFKKYFHFVGIVFANMFDRSHRCYCPKLFTRYEPSAGCLNGTRWVIQECDSQLDSSCFYNTMWREECDWHQMTPTWSEWTAWSACEAGRTDYLDIQKSDIKSSEKCVAGSMMRERFCRDDHRICHFYYSNSTRRMTTRTVYKNELVDLTTDAVTIAGGNHNIEVKLCHSLECEWGDCDIDNNRRRKKHCASSCKSVCDPRISICDIESVHCEWWLVIGKYILFTGVVWCYGFLLSLFCFCIICNTYRRKNPSQRKAYRETPTEETKIAEVEDSCSSDSPSESSDSEPLTKNDTEHSTLLQINEIE